ncbi:MAG: glycosyltransferase family 39 protein [Tepidisphaeraceae bacterium]|jgi:4-amino-4-deoxy-L-arabinose transferase-like glycosyltransferase
MMSNSFLSARRILAGLLLMGFILVGLVGSNRIPIIDRDEGWYTQISRTMLRSGDWVVPRFRGEVFPGKPVLAFWCQAASMGVFGATPFAARLPSTISGLLTLGLVWWGVRRTAGEKRALWATFVLSSSLLFMVMSKLALTDAELLLWIVIGEISLAALYMGKRNFWIAAVLWIALGLALMTKGPVAIGMFAGTAAALALIDVGRDFFSMAAWRRATSWWWATRPWLGVAIVVAVVLPWAMMVHARSPGFLASTLGTGMLGPIFVKPLDGRGSMHGIYLLLIWPGFAPWSILLPTAVLSGWRHRRLPVLRFCLAALIGPLLVIEGVQQKLMHYLLPLLPPLAGLSADVIARAVRNVRIMRPRGWKWGVTTWGIVVGCAGFLPWTLVGRFRGLPYAGMTFLSAMVLTVVGFTMWFMFTRRDRAAFVVMGIGSLSVAAIFMALVLPAFAPLSALRQAVGAMRDAGLDRTQPVALIGYSEPSITFYLDEQGKVYPTDYLQTHPAEQWPRWMILSSSVWGRLPPKDRDRLWAVGEFQVLSGGSSRGSGTIVVAKTRAAESQARRPGGLETNPSARSSPVMEAMASARR